MRSLAKQCLQVVSSCPSLVQDVGESAGRDCAPGVVRRRDALSCRGVTVDSVTALGAAEDEAFFLRATNKFASRDARQTGHQTATSRFSICSARVSQLYRQVNVTSLMLTVNVV